MDGLTMRTMMGGLSPQDFMPKVDYGQGAGKAWSPSTRSEVYQQADKAREDADFANQFAADIILSKEGTGGKVYDLSGKSVSLNKGYLYNKNSLNASQSWAGQAFGAPAIKGEDGNWYTAYSQLNMATGSKKVVSGGRDNHTWSTKPVYMPGKANGFGFIQGERITDADMIRQLSEGAYAFTAQGANGSTVYVPYASGYQVQKSEGGKPEAGNFKKDTAGGATARDSRTAYNVQPNVVGDPLGMRQTLLGGGMAQALNKQKTLLG